MNKIKNILLVFLSILLLSNTVVNNYAYAEVFEKNTEEINSTDNYSKQAADLKNKKSGSESI